MEGLADKDFYFSIIILVILLRSIYNCSVVSLHCLLFFILYINERIVYGND